MGELKRVPFRAMHTWRKWAGDEPCVLATGMERWLKSPGPSRVLVWSEDASMGERHYCDVQVEVSTRYGSRQVYLMSLITDEFVRSQEEIARDFGEEELDSGVQFSHVEDPFSNPLVRWPDPVDPDEVVRAVRGWTNRFWPDWEVDLVWGEVGDETHLWEGVADADVLLSGEITHCDVLLQCDSRLLGDVLKWASTYSAESVSEVGDYMLAIKRLPTSALPHLAKTWPDLHYVPVPCP